MMESKVNGSLTLRDLRRSYAEGFAPDGRTSPDARRGALATKKARARNIGPLTLRDLRRNCAPLHIPPRLRRGVAKHK